MATTLGRNLLILACTEVEAHWRGVLQENSVTPINGKDKDFTTKDYVKTCGPMELSQYVVVFPFYPWLEPIKPFEGWTVTGKPSKDIPWYAAYNSVKHDREQQFHQATLLHAFQAVTACAIMICAQYGETEQLSPFFSIKEAPRWSPADAYIFPYDGYASGGE